jgi:hypothetical protein
MNPNATSFEPTPPAERRWQLSLQTTCLMVLATAAGITVAINHREIPILKSRIESARALVRELDVTNPKAYHAVKLNQLWNDDERWEVYVPDGERRLYLATHEIKGAKTPPPVKSLPLRQGRHQFSLKTTRDAEGWRISVEVDDGSVIEANEPKSWNAGIGTSGGGEIANSTEFAPHKPLILFQQLMLVPDGAQSWTTPRSGNGIQLWIDRDQPPSGPESAKPN